MFPKILSALNGIYGLWVASFIVIPLLLLFLRQHRSFLIWLALTAVVEVLAFQRHLPLTAFKIAGLVLIPWCFFAIRRLFISSTIRIYLIYIAFILLLTAYFTFISPWPDTSGLRGVFDLGPARAIKQLGTLLGEFAIAFYVGLQLRDKKLRELMIPLLVGVIFIDIIGLYLEVFLKFDFYHFFTRSDRFISETRYRGFNYEPRGAGQVAAYGFLLLWGVEKIKWPIKMLIGLFLLGSLLFTLSFTGIIILAVGGLFLIITSIKWPTLLTRENRFALGGITALVLISGGLFFALFPQQRDIWIDHFERREFIVNSETFVGHFEVFDATALNFLIHEPLFLLTGVGAGQTALAATPYMISRDKVKFRHRNRPRVNALPSIGLLYQLSMGGLLGSLLFFGGWIRGGMALYGQRDKKQFIYSMLFLIIYIVQFRYLYPLIWGLGIGAEIEQKLKNGKDEKGIIS